jgi:hypothetical protein
MLRSRATKMLVAVAQAHVLAAGASPRDDAFEQWRVTKMKWNSRLVRALIIAATVGAMVLSAIADTRWA